MNFRKFITSLLFYWHYDLFSSYATRVMSVTIIRMMAGTASLAWRQVHHRHFGASTKVDHYI